MRIKHLPSHAANSGEPELFPAASGIPTARIMRSDGPYHFHSAIRPETEADLYRDISFWGDLIVFLGTGLGHHVRPYLKNIPASSRLLLIDYNPFFLDYCRQSVFTDLPNEIQAISSFAADGHAMVREAVLSASRIQVIKHPASYLANRTFYDDLQDALAVKTGATSGKKRALLFHGRFFLEEELRRALTTDDTEPFLFHYRQNAGPQFESALSRILQETRPDYILSVNMKGFDDQGIVAACAARLGIPVVVWFVDDPHPIVVPLRQSVKYSMIAFSWERSYLPWLTKMGFGKSAFLPLAGDSSLFPFAERSKNLADIGFVGSSMGGATLTSIASNFMWDGSLLPLVEEAAKRLCRNRTVPVFLIIEESCRKSGQPLPFSDEKNLTWLCTYVIHFASMLERKTVVETCLPLGITTFGDTAGWKAIIGDSVITRPDVDYRSGLADVYRSIGITVNATSLQMATAVNQRVFDVPLCGGFVLSDRQEDLFSLFASDEIEVYKSMESLCDKARYYLSHDTERYAISRRARTRILAEHTYRNRIAQIEKVL